MANPTTNFGWVMPTSTDLVTDLPADFAVFGQGVDTTMAELKGGTTGQVLSKTSNTDMDFTWVTDPGGDITGVTAGTGISGGGTSGTVTITNSMATEITAKGDLIVGTGSATFDNLAAGTNGQVLQADSTAATGLKWATAAAGGKVLQVIQATTNSNVTNATSTMADITGLTVSITPSASTSKILVMVSVASVVKASNSASNAAIFQLLRGASSIICFGGNDGYTNSATVAGPGTCGTTFLDSPATTSATTYKVQFANFVNGTNVAVNDYQNASYRPYSTITVMEIGA